MRRPYPSYRESGVEWLGEVPEHWKVRPTKYASRVIMGQSPSSDTYHDEPGERPFLQGNAEFGERSPTPKWYCDAAPKVVETGTLLLSVRAPVGALNKADQTYGIGRGLCGVAANQEHLDSGFAWWALHVTRRSLEPLSVGSTYEAVSAAEVGGMSLPAPPLTEQRSIAAFLDHETAKIDSLVEKNRLLLDRLAEFRTALITRTVTKGLAPEAARDAGLNPNPPLKSSGVEWIGDIPAHWEARRLKDVGTLVGGAGFPEALQGVEGEELPFFKVGDLSKATDGLWLVNPEHTIGREMARTLRAQVIPTGAIVYAKIGAALLLNRRRIVAQPSCIDNNMSAYIPDESRTVTQWALYTLSLIDFGLHVNPGAVPSLSEGDQACLHISAPPLAEQRAIVMFLDRQTARLDALSARVENAIERLQEYRTALITAAVTGKIDVRDRDAVEVGASRT